MPAPCSLLSCDFWDAELAFKRSSPSARMPTNETGGHGRQGRFLGSAGNRPRAAACIRPVPPLLRELMFEEPPGGGATTGEEQTDLAPQTLPFPDARSGCENRCLLDGDILFLKIRRAVVIRWIVRVARCSAVVAAGILLFAGLNWRGLLYVAADWWEIDERPGKADAVYVLGGGWQTRTLTAARLLHQGRVSRILISDVLLTTSDRVRETVPETLRMKSMLDVGSSDHAHRGCRQSGFQHVRRGHGTQCVVG